MVTMLITIMALNVSHIIDKAEEGMVLHSSIETATK